MEGKDGDGGGAIPPAPTDRHAAPQALGEVLRVIQSFHERYLADRAAGNLRPGREYAARYPGFEDVILQQYHTLREEDPPVQVPSSAGETLDRLLRLGPKSLKSSRELGRGGMGAVYRVRDEVLQRNLAMKVALDDAARIPVAGGLEKAPTVQSTSGLRRMIQEAQITAQLHHPGIVPVHEMRIDTEGRVFFTMTLIRGRTLGETFLLVREGREGWTRTRALQVFIRVCDTLAYAHSKGVLHRDLKPANVMVGSFGEVYVMDWGVAKVLGPGEGGEPPLTVPGKPGNLESPSAPLTLTGEVLGTPEYMPREQALGQREAADRRSDVYSVGAMLYELLAGEPPYTDPSSPRTAIRVLQAVVSGPPRDVAGIGKDVPAELAAICRKAMARDPADRYQTAEELSQDLYRYLDGRVVRAYRTGPLVEFRQWIRRNAAAAGTAAAAITLLVAGAVWFGLAQREAGIVIAGERDAARAAEATAERERARAVGLLLAAQAGTEVGRNPSLALQLAVEAAERAPGPEARDALYAALARHHEMRRLVGHDGYVNDGAWSPDGTRALTVEWGPAAFLWDAGSGAVLHRLLAHADSLHDACFSPDGTRVATASVDGTARIWDASSGTCLRVLSGHGGAVVSVAFSPDGLVLATAGDDGTVRLWSAAKGEEMRVLRGHGAPVRWVVFSPEGDRLASAAGDATCRVWDRASGREILSVRTREGPPDSRSTAEIGLPRITRTDRVLFAAGGRVLVTWSYLPGPKSALETLRLHRLEGDAAVPVLERTPSHAPAVSGDGRRVAACIPLGEKRWRIERWDAADPAQGRATDLPEQISNLALDGPGRRVAGNRGHETEVWDLDEGRRISVLRGHAYDLKAVFWSPDGARLLTTSADQTARIWLPEPPDASRLPAGTPPDHASADGRRLLRAEGDPGAEEVPFAVLETGGGGRALSRFRVPGPVRDHRWLRDDRHVLVQSVDRIRILDASTGAVKSSCPPAPGAPPIPRYSASDDLSRLFVKVEGNVVRVADLAKGEWLPVPLGEGVVDFDPSPDGRTLLTVEGREATGTLWDVESGKPRFVLAGHSGWTLQCAWSPDGKRVATSAMEGRARVWDPATGKQVALCGPLPMRNNSVSLGGGHRWLAVGSGETVFLFDPETGERWATLEETEEHGPIRSVALLPGGEEVATRTGAGGLVRRWALDPLPVARSRLPIETDPDVLRRFRILPEAGIDAYEAGWIRRHPRVRDMVMRALRLLRKGSVAEGVEWIEAAKALRPGHELVDWGEACGRARLSASLPPGEERTRARERALDALARVLAEEGVRREQVRTEELLDPIRDDPRYRALVGD